MIIEVSILKIFNLEGVDYESTYGLIKLRYSSLTAVV